MSRTELVDFIAEDAGVSKAVAAKMVDSFWKGITKGLKESGKVTFVGQGTFAVKTREAREGINPLTKQPMKIPAKQVVNFKPGSKLKESIN